MAVNRGVYIDPSHNLYIADAEPPASTIQAGSTLKSGEITVAIKSSGICG
jgi:L-iditol 2-dehydrogenase